MLQFPRVEDCLDLDSTVAGKRAARLLLSNRSVLAGGGDSSTLRTPAAGAAAVPKKKQLGSMGLMIARQNATMLQTIAKNEDRSGDRGGGAPKAGGRSSAAADRLLKGLPREVREQLIVRDEVEAMQASIIRRDLDSTLDLYQRTVRQEENQLIAEIADPLRVAHHQLHGPRHAGSGRRSSSATAAQRQSDGGTAAGSRGADFLAVGNARQLQAALRRSVVCGPTYGRPASAQMTSRGGFAARIRARRRVDPIDEFHERQQQAVAYADAIVAQRRRDLLAQQRSCNQDVQMQARVVIDGETFYYNELFRMK
jgi:hypothetical protein